MSSPLRNPDYLKAAASIRDQFTGKSPGIALPSERRLAEQLGLGRSIINRAVLHLITEGVLRREGYKLYTTAREETSTDTPQRIVILKNDLFIRQFRTSDNIWIEYRPVNPENPAQAVREVAGNLPLPEGLIVAPGHVESLSFTEAVLEINRAGVEVVSLFRRIPGISAVLLSANQAMTTLLDHLNALGHRELACVAGQAADPWDHELSEAYVLTCRNLGFSQSAGRVYPLFPARLMPAKRLLKETLTSRPRPTALVCTDDFHAAAMMRACHQLKVRVPEDISITGFGDRPEIIGSDPPLTTLRTDEALLRDLAIQVVRNRLRSRKTGTKPAPCRVALAQPLIERHSTASPPGNPDPGPRRPLAGNGARNRPKEGAIQWPTNEQERKRLAHDTWLRAYPKAAKTPARRFKPVSLTRVVNRSRLRGHAFLGGEGLQHFPPGLHRIHGVPFDVLDETERGDASVLSVACGSAHTSQGKTLPERVRIPVGYRAAALYFLHAAGWVQGGETCVTHTINYEGRSRHTLPIVPLGYRSYQPNSGDSSGTEPNIQDWWRDYPRFNSGTARHCVITRDGDPLLYERYLYTLEWVNPHPERAIRSITMRARSNSASYALIALTVLEPEEP